MKIAFQMEPLSEVNPVKNNSLKLMYAAQQRGHKLYQFHPRELVLTNNAVLTRARRVAVDYSADPFYRLSQDEMLDLSTMDVVMIRQDPPYNMEYLTTTYILERLPQTTLVINRPQSVRHYPEKFFPFLFSDFCPETCIGYDAEIFRDFLASQKEIIIKPLYLFGGRDVFHLKEHQAAEIAPLVERLVTETRAPVVAQRFLPQVREGDKRILLLDGEPVGAFLRVPQKGSIRANLMQGGSLVACELSENDEAICAALRPVLKKEQIMICGIDIIGKYLTEINVTSPIGFMEIEKLYGIKAADLFWEKVEVLKI